MGASAAVVGCIGAPAPCMRTSVLGTPGNAEGAGPDELLAAAAAGPVAINADGAVAAVGTATATVPLAFAFGFADAFADGV